MGDYYLFFDEAEERIWRLDLTLEKIDGQRHGSTMPVRKVEPPPADESQLEITQTSYPPGIGDSGIEKQRFICIVYQ